MNDVNEGAALLPLDVKRPPSVARSVRLPIDVDDQIKAMMEQTGQSFSQCVIGILSTTSSELRDLLVEDQVNRNAGVEMLGALNELTQELNNARNEVRRHGTLVNQIAKRVNSEEFVILSEKEEQAIFNALTSIVDFQKQVDELTSSYYHTTYSLRAKRRSLGKGV